MHGPAVSLGDSPGPQLGGVAPALRLPLYDDAGSLPAEIRRFRDLVQLAQARLAACSHAVAPFFRNPHWLAVDDSGRWWATSEPRLRGFVDVDGLWCGPPARSLPPQHTEIEVAGQWWAQLALPLPEDDEVALLLLVQQAWHATGEQVLFPYSSSPVRGVSGLTRVMEPERRACVRLEVEALRAMAGAGVAEVRMRLADGLFFRRQRLAGACRDEARREKVVELTEGLAAYASRAVMGYTIDNADEPWTHLSRHGWYDTYPDVRVALFGLGLDAVHSTWFTDAVKHELWTDAVLNLVGDPPSWEDVRSRYDVLGAVEQERAETRHHEVLAAQWRKRAVSDEVVRVELTDLNLSFDPLRVRQLPGGTVYEVLEWGDDSGAMVRVEEGAWVSSDFREIVLWCGSGSRPSTDDVAAWRRQARAGEEFRLSGPGWSVSLPAGWTVRLGERGAVCAPTAVAVGSSSRR